MADPLSTAASVAGLLGLAIQLSQLSFQYVASIKGSSKSWSSLTSVLLKAQQASDAAGNHSIITASSIPPLALQECQVELRQLKAILSEKLRKQGLRGKLEILAWPFSESETGKRVQTLHRFSALLNSSLVTDNLSFEMASYCHLQDMKDVKHAEELLSWLEPKCDPPPIALETIAEQVCPDTGKAALASEPYFSWHRDQVATRTKPLWVCGPLGCGKTHLVATILDDIFTSFPDATVSYHFFRDGRQESLSDVFRHLVWQHLSQPTGLSKLAERIYSKSKPTKAPVLLKELVKILCDIGSSSGRAYLILDGLDEFPHYSKLLKHLPEFTAAGIRVLVSSRDLPAIQTLLSGAVVHDARAGRSDIEAYVSWRLEEDSELDEGVFTAELKEEICTKLVEHIRGSFLLCRLLMDRICSATTVKSLRTQLQTLPSSYEDAYTDTLSRILKQKPERRELASHALSWVCVSVRPLDMPELRHAVASLDTDTMSYDDEELATDKSIISSCLGMLVAPKTGSDVELVHSSAREFVVRRLGLHDQATQLSIGKACLKYMSTPQLSKGLCTSVSDLQTRLQSFPFLDYAARHYGVHARPVEDGMLLELLTKSAEDMFSSIPGKASSIHVAYYWGFPSVLTQTLAASSSSHMLDWPDSHGWTGLHWATSTGHEDVVKILLDAGAKMEAVDQGGWTPLFWAALKGHAPIVRLLLDQGADPFRTDNSGMTPFHWSVLSGAKQVAILLLDHGKKFKAKTQAIMPPKAISVAQAKLLQGSTELAPRKGDVEGFSQLAASFILYRWKGYHEAGLNFRDFDNVWDQAKVVLSKGEGLMWNNMAATSRVDAVRCQLLTNAILCEDIQMHRHGKDLARDVVTRYGATYVHVAAYSGSAEIMRVLIDRGLPLDVVDERGMTPLHYACRTGTFQVVDMILGAGVKVDARLDKSGLTPLMVLMQFGAWRTCNNPGETIRIMQALVSHGASVRANGASGHNVIHYAVLTYDSTVINALLDLGADPAAMANGLVTPLHILTTGYCGPVWPVWDILELRSEGFRRKQYWDFIVPPDDKLIDKQPVVELILLASPEGSLAAVTEDGGNPLGLAIQTRNWDVAQALHRAGAPFLRSSQQVVGSSIWHGSESIYHDLDNVSEQGFYEFTRLLLQQGARPKSQGLLATIAVKVPAQKPHLWTKSLSGLGEGSEKFPLRDHAKVIRELTSAGVISDHKSRHLRRTGVQLAADRGVDGELLSALLDGGSDPYSETDQGVDSFHLALVCGKEDNLKILLDYAVADGTSRDHWITDWLQKQDSNCWTSTFEAYMSALQHADLIDCRDNNGHTLLFRAVQRGNMALVSELLKLGANPRTTDGEYGNSETPMFRNIRVTWHLREAETPLQIMFRNNRFTRDDKFFEVVRMLIAAGADPKGIADKMSIDDIAKFEGHEDLWVLVSSKVAYSNW
ncbi:ankyrin [Rhypophila decipiens]